jgi:hypothetical protein
MEFESRRTRRKGTCWEMGSGFGGWGEGGRCGCGGVAAAHTHSLLDSAKKTSGRAGLEGSREGERSGCGGVAAARSIFKAWNPQSIVGVTGVRSRPVEEGFFLLTCSLLPISARAKQCGEMKRKTCLSPTRSFYDLSLCEWVVPAPSHQGLSLSRPRLLCVSTTLWCLPAILIRQGFRGRLALRTPSAPTTQILPLRGHPTAHSSRASPHLSLDLPNPFCQWPAVTWASCLVLPSQWGGQQDRRVCSYTGPPAD